MSKMEKHENEEKKILGQKWNETYLCDLKWMKSWPNGRKWRKKFFWMPVPGLELTTFGSMCTVNISIHNNRKKSIKIPKNKIIAYNVYQSIE